MVIRALSVSLAGFFHTMIHFQDTRVVGLAATVTETSFSTRTQATVSNTTDVQCR